MKNKEDKERNEEEMQCADNLVVVATERLAWQTINDSLAPTQCNAMHHASVGFDARRAKDPTKFIDSHTLVEIFPHFIFIYLMVNM